MKRSKKKLKKALGYLISGFFIALLGWVFYTALSNPNEVSRSGSDDEFQALPSNLIGAMPTVVDCLTGQTISNAEIVFRKLAPWIRIDVTAKGYLPFSQWFEEGSRVPTTLVLSSVQVSDYKRAAWKNPNGPKLIHLQFDGMTEEAFLPLLQKGMLPAFNAMLAKGTWRQIESCCSMISASVWTTVDTGLSPEQHGIEGFVIYPSEGEPPIAVNSSHIKAPRLWNILRSYGGKAIVGGILFPDPGDDILVNLGGLPEKLARARRVVDETKPDLVVLYEKTVDNTGHLWWHTHSKESLIKNGWDFSESFSRFHHGRLNQAYQDLNAWVAFALSIAGPDTTIIAHSDHGFMATFSSPAEIEPKLFEILLEDPSVSAEMAPDRKLVLRSYEIKNAEVITTKLASIRLENGSSPFMKIEPCDKTPGNADQFCISAELNWPALLQANHAGRTLVLEDKNLLVKDYFHYSDRSIPGEHFHLGILAAAGNNIRKGVKLNDPQVIDLMKNNLAILGLPIADDMIGRVWTELYKKPPEIRRISTFGNLAKITVNKKATKQELDALRQLGYIQ